jgi:hypothetical protein
MAKESELIMVRRRCNFPHLSNNPLVPCVPGRVLVFNKILLTGIITINVYGAIRDKVNPPNRTRAGCSKEKAIIDANKAITIMAN